MRAISIMYHDVVGRGEWETSGFPGADAALYKLEREAFAAHLRAIAESVREHPVRVTDIRLAPQPAASPLMITFDDGGVSAYTHIADMLEEHGWRGHFLVTTDYIDKPGFLKREQIRELHRRGHVIGSHSASHPQRMAHCGWDECLREWRTSLQALSDVLGEKVEVASVPGGYYSKKVAEAAAEAGIKRLFTSEPTSACHEVSGCLILGRYTIQRWMSPQTAAGLARGKLTPCLRQKLLWSAKKMTKALGGQYYLKLRLLVLGRTDAPGNP
jgi:peptidoglycan/xylan/chitin deacetylase (PgdA/CDA1 family)